MSDQGTITFAQKIFHFPLTKIIIGMVVLVGIVVLGQTGTGKLLNYLSIDKIFKTLIIGVITAVLSICSYFFLFRFYEKRKIKELSIKGIWKILVAGIFLGAILQTLTIFIIYLNGGFTIISVNPVYFLLPPLVMASTSAIFEELLVRGIIFRITEEKLGSYPALIISAIIFGAMHLANPNSSLKAGIGLALQAGLFLGAAYIYARNLWFPIAIHFAWNFTQAGIFGATISGHVVKKSLLTTKIEGAEWFTGGQFGPEGSVQATLLCLIATAVLLFLSQKQNKMIKPFFGKIRLHP